MAVERDSSVDISILAARIDEGGTVSAIVGPEGAQLTAGTGDTTADFRQDLGEAAVFARPGPAFKMANIVEDTRDFNPTLEI